MEGIEFYRSGLTIPSSFITSELSGLFGSHVLTEMSEIIGFYKVYEKGAEFTAEGSNGDYVPADLRYKQATSLINKEARFLFARTPDLWVRTEGDTDKDRETRTQLQSLVDKVLQANGFRAKLIKAAKDCFIGKRVGYMVNFNEVKQTIKVNFLPSLEFVYETDPEDTERLTKFVAFYITVDTENKNNQRIYRKKYWMQNGFCWIEEGLYNGIGELVEAITTARATKFTYIPAGVILNDGLTGDMDGESDLQGLDDFESWYSRIANANIDSERKGMNPVRYAIDMNPNSTKNLSVAPGAFWDLQTDQALASENGQGKLGVLETTPGYTNDLNYTLSRIRSAMYEQVDVPDVSPDALKGVVSSGKTLRAIYWGLIVRCDEKMLAWGPALERIVELIIEGSRLYPGSARGYVSWSIPEIPFEVEVTNQYPLPEEEAEEKTIDLAEVEAQTMSRRSYMKKWRNLTDDEADEELRQIAREREILEDTFSGIQPQPAGDSVGEGGE